MDSRDIARLAGVSRSTVSRVVNNYSNVPEQTRQRVLEVIKKYNYVPHASASQLAGGQNRIIGLFMVDKKADTQGHTVTASPYFSPFITGVLDSANRAGYHVLAYAVSNIDGYENVKKVFYNKTISGGIFIGQHDDGEISEIIEGGFKTVLIDRSFNLTGSGNNPIIINADNVGGAFQAVSYLIGLSHRRIAHVTGYAGQLSTDQRLQGYKEALIKAGIPYDPALVASGDFLQGGGYCATNKLLEEARPTAIFYANDTMAIGGMAAISERGLRIPQDLSVIGFDDIELSGYLQPALTTVRMPLGSMSETAVNSLINLILNEPGGPNQRVVPVELIKRQSCSGPSR